jgi:hypothetical protein
MDAAKLRPTAIWLHLGYRAKGSSVMAVAWKFSVRRGEAATAVETVKTEQPPIQNCSGPWNYPLSGCGRHKYITIGLRLSEPQLEAVQTGIFESAIRICNGPFIDLYKSVVANTGRNSSNVKKRINGCLNPPY